MSTFNIFIYFKVYIHKNIICNSYKIIISINKDDKSSNDMANL